MNKTTGVMLVAGFGRAWICMGWSLTCSFNTAPGQAPPAYPFLAATLSVAGDFAVTGHVPDLCFVVCALFCAAGFLPEGLVAQLVRAHA
jgi:hypothetical protein